MADVKVGNISFSVDALTGITLTEAYEVFAHIRKDLVKIAYEQVNGKKVKKTKN
jgi:hypothetical protein